MSHYTEIKLALQLKDKDCVLRALELCGFRRDQIEVHEVPQQLLDYQDNLTHYRWKDHGDVRFKSGDCAHIIIRREHMGQAQNDFGIYLDAEHDVVFLCDFAMGCDPQYCSNEVARELGNYSGWLRRFGDEYAAQETIQYHQNQGQYAERVLDEDGAVCVYANA